MQSWHVCVTEQKRGCPSESQQRPAKKQKLDLRPVADVQYDAVGHWPILDDVQQRKRKFLSCIKLIRD